MVHFALTLPADASVEGNRVVVINVPKSVLLHAEQNQKAVNVVVDEHDVLPLFPATYMAESHADGLIIPVPLDELDALQRVIVVPPTASTMSNVKIDLTADSLIKACAVSGRTVDDIREAQIVVPVPKSLTERDEVMRLVVPCPVIDSHLAHDSIVQMSLAKSALDQGDSAISFVNRTGKSGDTSTTHIEAEPASVEEGWELVASRSTAQLIDVHILFEQESRLLHLPDLILLQKPRASTPFEMPSALSLTRSPRPVLLLRPVPDLRSAKAYSSK